MSAQVIGSITAKITGTDENAVTPKADSVLYIINSVVGEGMEGSMWGNCRPAVMG